MHEAFQQFVELVPPEGLVIACGDEPTVQELIGHWKVGRLEERKTGRLEDWNDESPPEDVQPSNLPTFHSSSLPTLTTYGLDPHNDWRALDLRPNAHGGYDFSIATNLPAFQPSNLPTHHASTSIPGVHNVKNALAALIVADRLGVPVGQAATSLASFNGVGRRFEIKGQAGGVLVVDDYAHHPTEIQATLAAARTHYPDRAIWAVFQPHTYSRTRTLLDDFAAAFADADHVILVDIFPARETDDGSVSSRDILARMKHPDARFISGLGDAGDFLSGRLQSGDMLITLGAGDGYRVGEMVIQGLGSNA
jgi:UDP-N-acetylmuramate--alanine ligase